MLLPAETFFVLADGEDVGLESTVLEDVWMSDDERVETPVGAFWLTVTLVTGSMGNMLAEKVPEAEDGVAEEAEDRRSDELEVESFEDALEVESLEEALEEILVVDLELLLLCLVDTETGVDFELVTLVDLIVAFCDVDFFDDVEDLKVDDGLLEVLVFLVEVELLIEDDAFVEIETCFNAVLIEDVDFFVDDVVFRVEDVTFLVDDDIFLMLVVFFAAATEEDEAEAWMHLQALLTWATFKPLTVDFEFLLESHDLQ